ncbi:uncharacterized protein LOC129716602 [Wyeomyia smithii]|uniref:uncharacterized protein LOC129716602 n=1 Tax=Wyeomyia smithii TaxID=174621 RepID=UPI002467E42D|nr:uncharacterized protein LOC129716602 [Wyeomyia smithii]
MFMTDFPVASAFCGLLISEDYKLMKPGASAFVETWDSLQLRVLERQHEMFRYIKNNFIRAVAIIRVKNPTRGSKRLRDQNEEDFLKTNPLHGVVQWIEDGQTLPVPEIPQVIIVGPEFHDGLERYCNSDRSRHFDCFRYSVQSIHRLQREMCGFG